LIAMSDLIFCHTPETSEFILIPHGANCKSGKSY